MKKKYLILLSILSGIILAAAWPEKGFPGLMFIGLVPLLYLEDYLTKQPGKFIKFCPFLYVYPAFFTWNLLTTWWIYHSTAVGAIMAIVLNAFFLAIVFQAYSWVKKQLKNKLAGYLALLSFWIAFEYLHLNWLLTWPWLNLGNSFAGYYQWVQWYEYTGTLGGTLWVIMGNILAFEAIQKITISRQKSENRVFPSGFVIPGLVFIFWVLTPIILSYCIYQNYHEKADPVNFVVVQPNIDPYEEQYTLPPSQVIGRILSLAAPLLDSATNFLVAPESAIQENMWEDDLASSTSIQVLKKVVLDYPNLNILIGGSTFKAYQQGENISNTARRFTNSEGYYDAYNTAIMITTADSLQLYHKSKLTPGVEALPSFRKFKWLEKFAIDLGGTVGSLGTDQFRKVYSATHTVKVSPIICYESVFGEFFGEFVRNGAQVMIIITNDGWWGNTPGHRQHYAFSHLRAIETRRSIARSANTGISGFIDQRGDAFQCTPYWEPAAIKGILNANDYITFYVRHGDYLARFAVWLTFILLVIAVVFAFFSRKKMMKYPYKHGVY